MMTLIRFHRAPSPLSYHPDKAFSCLYPKHQFSKYGMICWWSWDKCSPEPLAVSKSVSSPPGSLVRCGPPFFNYFNSSWWSYLMSSGLLVNTVTHIIIAWSLASPRLLVARHSAKLTSCPHSSAWSHVGCTPANVSFEKSEQKIKSS